MTVIAMIGSNGGHRNTKLLPLSDSKCIFSTIAWVQLASLKKPDLPIRFISEANA